LAAPGGEDYSALILATGLEDTGDEGVVALYNLGDANRLVIAPGERNGQGSLTWSVLSASDDNLTRSMLQVEASTLDNVGNLRPFIDLSGTGAPSDDEKPFTVVHDLWWGIPGTAAGDEPTVVQSYSRGADTGWRTETANDVTLSTTAGTYTTLLEILDIDLWENRLYEVVFSGADNLLSGGSGFAAGDQWRWRIHRRFAGGVYSGIEAQASIRATATAAQRYPVRSIIGYFSPPVDGVCDFKVEMAKISGAATVTSSVQNDGGANVMSLQVKDIGAHNGDLH
jgi:hypothetical protein